VPLEDVELRIDEGLGSRVVVNVCAAVCVPGGRRRRRSMGGRGERRLIVRAAEEEDLESYLCLLERR
jgi:hypothetical protein